MGAPKRKTAMMMLRLAPGELRRIEKAARVAGLPCSAWVRRIALLNAPGGPPPSEKTTRALQQKREQAREETA